MSFSELPQDIKDLLLEYWSPYKEIMERYIIPCNTYYAIYDILYSTNIPRKTIYDIDDLLCKAKCAPEGFMKYLCCDDLF